MKLGVGRWGWALGTGSHYPMPDAQHLLPAKLKGGVTTFDNIDYEVHAAVFGTGGELLGTAKALVPVERLWLGKALLKQQEVALDFGISEAYPNAASFTIGISDRKVLTPDQWQK